MLEEMGLASAITWYLEGFTQRSGIKTSVDIPSDLERLSRDVELALFRILQESLTNIHKHSGSDKAEIKVFRTGELVTAEVRDYGKGLSKSVLNQAEAGWNLVLGIGLRGMAERIRQLGGELTISAIQPGTIVRAIVPARSSLAPMRD